MLRVHVCEERTGTPFKRRATVGMAVGNMFVAGAWVMRKWLVAPESRRAHGLMVLAPISIVLRRNEAARA
jgi:hypothetical protein